MLNTRVIVIVTKKRKKCYQLRVRFRCNIDSKKKLIRAKVSSCKKDRFCKSVPSFILKPTQKLNFTFNFLY